jgi:hypothetical protein
MLTKTERNQRVREINAGVWDEAWITLSAFHSSRQFFAVRSAMRPDGTVRFTDRLGRQLAIVDPGDVVSVRH